MKITKINLSKSVTVQIEQFEPINSFYAVEIELEKGDDVEKIKQEQDEILAKWIEFERLKWKAPNRAITAGKKLGVIVESPTMTKFKEDKNKSDPSNQTEELPF